MLSLKLQRVLLAAGLLVPTEAAMRRVTQLILLVSCRATLFKFYLNSLVGALESKTRANHWLSSACARLLLVSTCADPGKRLMTIGTCSSIHLHFDHLLLVLARVATHTLHLASRIPLGINVVNLEAVPDALQRCPLPFMMVYMRGTSRLVLCRLTSLHQAEHGLLLLLLCLRHRLLAILHLTLISVLHRNGPL